MKFRAVVVATILTLGSGYARSQDVGQSYGGDIPQQEGTAQPSGPPPKQTPPAPPVHVSPPTQAQIQTVPQAAAQSTASGQWVYTAQYGWVWIPYGSQYTYQPTQAGENPYEYVYYPSYGWTWLAAPWVFGWGVGPFFGPFGPAHFAWFHHPFFVGGGWHAFGVRPAFRGGFGHVGGVPVRGFSGRPAPGGFRGGFNGGHMGGFHGGGFGGGFHGGGGGFHGGGGGGHR